MTNPQDQTVMLGDGRRLAYREYGAPSGRTALYFHGHPGSRLDLTMFDPAILEQSGLRLIAIDRPGIGLSTPKAGRKLLDWPADVREFSDLLGLERFAVIGLSGGGPFAAACAYALPERVEAAVLISSVGFFDQPGATENMGTGLQYFKMANRLPLAARLQMGMMGYGLRKSPEQALPQIQAGLPPADQAVMAETRVSQGFIATVLESLGQGAGRLVEEGGLYLRPWGFSLGDIHVPVALWHGEADRNAPIAMGRQLAALIPGCQARFIPEEGHFSLAVHHLGEVLQPLA